nr:hypothetical protein SHINE37_42422 [Rhizobiaceae bacterium]
MPAPRSLSRQRRLYNVEKTVHHYLTFLQKPTEGR